MEPPGTSQDDPTEGLPTLRIFEPESIDPTERSAIEALKEDLYDCQVETEQGNFFIPEGTLERIIKQDRVQSTIEECLPDLTQDEALQYATKICQHEPSFRKIFAISVFSDMIESIVRFVDRGIDDSYLPMPDPRRSITTINFKSIGILSSKEVVHVVYTFLGHNGWCYRPCSGAEIK